MVPNFCLVRLMDDHDVDIHHPKDLCNNFKVQLNHTLSDVRVTQNDWVVLGVVIFENINLKSIENEVLADLYDVGGNILVLLVCVRKLFYQQHHKQQLQLI